MAEPKWTKGPYAVDPDDRDGMEWNRFIVEAARPHMRLAFMANSGDDDERGEATAHLFAAAPSLYEALTQAEQLLNHMGDILNNMDAVSAEDVQMATPIFETVRAALALARGEQ
jgi:hypothetical protein